MQGIYFPVSDQRSAKLYRGLFFSQVITGDKVFHTRNYKSMVWLNTSSLTYQLTVNVKLLKACYKGVKKQA